MSSSVCLRAGRRAERDKGVSVQPGLRAVHKAAAGRPGLPAGDPVAAGAPAKPPAAVRWHSLQPLALRRHRRGRRLSRAPVRIQDECGRHRRYGPSTSRETHGTSL